MQSLHLLRRRRHPRGQARLLPPPERPHPGPGRGPGLRHAAHDLQRLHAEPAPGEQASCSTTPRSSRASTRNLAEVGAATYSGGVEVRHLLWEIAEGDGYERFKAIAVKSLTGLRVAPFYGCQILRPSKLLGFEDPDRPSSLERLITACGGRAGGLSRQGQVLRLPHRPGPRGGGAGGGDHAAQQAADAGADVMVTPCPLCHLSLDAWQAKAEKKAGREFHMPILHLAQLLGAAAGIREDELKFTRHVVRLPASTRDKLLRPGEEAGAAPVGEPG